MSSEIQRPIPPRSGIVYGNTIYWGTLAGSIVAIIGSVIAFIWLDKNVLDAAHAFAAIWRGESVGDIWVAAGGYQPNGHWHLDELDKGDAIAMSGLAFSVASVVPGMIWSAKWLFTEGDKAYGVVALISATFILLAMLGLIAIPG